MYSDKQVWCQQLKSISEQRLVIDYKLTREADAQKQFLLNSVRLEDNVKRRKSERDGK